MSELEFAVVETSLWLLHTNLYASTVTGLQLKAAINLTHTPRASRYRKRGAGLKACGPSMPRSVTCHTPRNARVILMKIAITAVGNNKLLRSLSLSNCVDCAQRALSCRANNMSCRLLHETPENGVKPDEVCFNSVVTACAKSGRWEEAVGLLAEMLASSSSSSCSPRTTAAPAAGTRGSHTPAGTREINGGGGMRARGSRSPATATATAVRGNVRSGGGGGNAENLKRPARAGRFYCRPNVVTYNAAIQACGSAGRWREALTLLRGMLSEKISPNATSFTSAIASCGFAGEWQQALGLLRAVKDINGGGLLSVGSYNAAVRACGEAGRYKEAVGVLREMEADAKKEGASSDSSAAPAPDVTTYTAAITACGVAREYKQAVLLLREMPTVGITPNKISYNAAITACSRSERWELSLALFREMAILGVSPDIISYNSVISALGSAGEWERAISVLREMMPVESDSAGTGTRTGAGGGGVSPDHVSFATVIRTCEMARRFEEAGELRTEAAVLGLLPAMHKDGTGEKGRGGGVAFDRRGEEGYTTITGETGQ